MSIFCIWCFILGCFFPVSILKSQYLRIESYCSPAKNVQLVVLNWYGPNIKTYEISMLWTVGQLKEKPQYILQLLFSLGKTFIHTVTVLIQTKSVWKIIHRVDVLFFKKAAYIRMNWYHSITSSTSLLLFPYNI